MKRDKYNNQRAQNNDIFLYGRKPILELLKNSPEQIKEVLVSENSNLEQIQTLLDSKKIQYKKLNPEKLDDILPEANHQGIIAKIEARQAIDLGQLIKYSLSEKANKTLLILDQIQDPHNLGSIFRVAEAMGVDGIVLSKANSVTVNSTVRKVSAGATEFVRYSLVGNLAQAIEKIKKEGFWILGTSLDEDAKSIVNYDFAFPLGIVLGSEGTGMRSLTKSLCDYLLQIPMTGKIQSLNVNQAASIVLFNVMASRI